MGVTHMCEWVSLWERSSRQNSDRTFILLLSYFRGKVHSGSTAAAMLRRPLLSSTVMLSPPDSTISCSTVGIRWNTFCIVTAGKLSQASLTVAASPSGSHLLLRCLTSTAAWMLIQMPRSKAFTSGEHADCCNIIILNLSFNLLVYSSLAARVLWPPALSITR